MEPHYNEAERNMYPGAMCLVRANLVLGDRISRHDVSCVAEYKTGEANSDTTVSR